MRTQKKEADKASPFEANVVTFLLTLGELEAGASGLFAVLLALFYAGVTGDETGFFEYSAQFWVVQEQSFGYAVLDGTCLTCITTARHGHIDIKDADFFDQLQRLAYNHLGCFAAEIFVKCFIVDGELTIARLQPYPCYRAFAFACSVIADCCH